MMKMMMVMMMMRKTKYDDDYDYDYGNKILVVQLRTVVSPLLAYWRQLSFAQSPWNETLPPNQIKKQNGHWPFNRLVHVNQNKVSKLRNTGPLWGKSIGLWFRCDDVIIEPTFYVLAPLLTPSSHYALGARQLPIADVICDVRPGAEDLMNGVHHLKCSLYLNFLIVEFPKHGSWCWSNPWNVTTKLFFRTTVECDVNVGVHWKIKMISL